MGLGVMLYYMESVSNQRPSEEEERETAECPVCGGTVLSPRSGSYWNCNQCARKWVWDELN
jgi:ribosomal protein L37AE/L43A